MQHCILVKWTPDAGDKDALAKEATALTIRRNVINRPNRYDLLIELTMTPDMLPAYDASEPHHRWKETFGARIQQKAIFDYE